MAAVVASKVKRKRQMALEGKLGHQESLKETQLHQRRLATASKEAAEKRKAAQYYRQVELLPREKTTFTACFLLYHMASFRLFLHNVLYLYVFIFA